MTKEQELMNYMHKKVFDPILSSSTVPANIKNHVRLTMGRMNCHSAEKMVQYFWSALVQGHSIAFSKQLKAAGITRFEDVMEEFRDIFNDAWLRS